MQALFLLFFIFYILEFKWCNRKLEFYNNFVYLESKVMENDILFIVFVKKMQKLDLRY